MSDRRSVNNAIKSIYETYVMVFHRGRNIEVKEEQQRLQQLVERSVVVPSSALVMLLSNRSGKPLPAVLKNQCGVKLDRTVTGIIYLDMLQNFLIPQIDEDEQQDASFYYQQDGAPPHNLTDVRDFLNGRFPGRWMAFGG
ncbi:hypothetical protein J6590_098198 [Homalodisca vitripennis]|nr:hypothetical protein J6590_098198 [Homalodisca vitripennis]